MFCNVLVISFWTVKFIAIRTWILKVFMSMVQTLRRSFGC